METLDNELNVHEETRQMKVLQMYQKLVIFTLLKYKWSIMLVFLLAVLCCGILRHFQYKGSLHKHEGSVTLFYTPRASEEVKPLSLNHVLGIFSKQQIFQQLIEELHLNEIQQANLKRSIEVKLLRDHNDMFVITGIGESDEYVKLLVNTFVSIGIRNYEEYRAAELRNFLENRQRHQLELQNIQHAQIEKKHALHRKYGIIHPVDEMATVKKIQGEQSAALADLNVKLADSRHRFAVAKKNYDAIPPAVIRHRAALRQFIQQLSNASREYEKMKLMFAERNPRFVEAKAAYETILNEFETFRKQNEITVFEEGMLLDIEGHINRYQEAEVLLNQHELSMKSLQAEIKLIKEKEVKLQQMIPEHDRIDQYLTAVNKSITLLVEELNRVQSNIAHVSNDIVINERLVSTKTFSAFPFKILAIIAIAGCFV
ncbi:MAG: hypothetical protein J6S21_02800, partial [Victivallales bacterium]|nr:hypothetical protein [Victivallales bacterium]